MSEKKREESTAKGNSIVEEEKSGYHDDDHATDDKGVRRKAVRKKGARVATDKANSGEIDDYNVDRERDDCRSETVRWRMCHRREAAKKHQEGQNWKRDLKKWPAKEETEGEEAKVI